MSVVPTKQWGLIKLTSYSGHLSPCSKYRFSKIKVLQRAKNLSLLFCRDYPYVEQWQKLINLLGRRDFLYVADSKIITKENMAQIHDNDGFFIAPAPMYESYKTPFHEALDQHDHEILIPYKDKINSGFEIPLTKNRVANTKTAFKELGKKLNKYKLKTEEAIDKACASILKKYYTTDFFEYSIKNEPLITYKNKKGGIGLTPVCIWYHFEYTSFLVNIRLTPYGLISICYVAFFDTAYMGYISKQMMHMLK